MPAVFAGRGAELHHPVGRQNGVFVMLHDNQRIVQVTQFFERFNQAVIVARVQADGRLVQHIQHAREAGADLRGQVYALGLAARKRLAFALQRQVRKPHAV